MDAKASEIRLWLVNRIAEVLADLADDGTATEVEMEETLDQMRNVGDLLLEAIGFEFVEADGDRATIRVGDG